MTIRRLVSARAPSLHHLSRSRSKRRFLTIADAPKEQAPTTLHLHDQCTGSIRKSYEASTHDQVEDIISKATQAQKIWSTEYTIHDRAQLLKNISKEIRNRREELIQMEVCDTARSLNEVSSYDIFASIDCIEYYTSLVQSQSGVTGQQYIKLESDNFAYTSRQPFGVTVGIGAWNYPLVNSINKSIPSLLFGNAMIFKPSELTPTSALCLEKIYKQSDMPDEIFNVVLGNHEIGSLLVQHPSISKISLTGSEHTGKVVSQLAAASSTFKSLTLELGGKSPLIIFDDANLQESIIAAMVANWYANGQVCSNGTRVFVHESIHDEFVDGLIKETKKLRIGKPTDVMTDIGPMISKKQMEKVLEYIDVGVNVDSAKLAYGGQMVEPLSSSSSSSEASPDDSNGYFLSPAIFTNCTDDMRIVQEEVFGMLMSILTFSDEEEVLQRANASKFGLAAGIFTKDMQRAHRLSSQLQAGTVWINNYNLGHVQLPWSGWKQSGLGSENGTASIDAWTQNKSVYVEMNQIENPFSYRK